MRLSISSNFDDRLLEQLALVGQVSCVYGKLTTDVIGGGRPALMLPSVGRDQVARHVAKAHALGLEFNYLLNASCLDNQELSEPFHSRTLELLDWLVAIGVDSVTVALPYLIGLVRQRAPQLKISVSSLAIVDTLDKARQFERMGVQELTLYEDLNRNFPLLRKIRGHVSCDLRLIATNSCRLSCGHRLAHTNANAHASQDGHPSRGRLIDHSILGCIGNRVAHPVELLKAPWIRPEDLAVYEDLGYDRFKITERAKTTDRLVETARAYVARRHDGDLLRLLGTYAAGSALPPNGQLIETSGVGEHPLFQQGAGLFGALSAFSVDNRALDGFLSHFVEEEPDCANLLCGEECRHCHTFAERAVRFDPRVTGALTREFEAFFAGLWAFRSGA